VRRYGFACWQNFLARACRVQRHVLHATAFNVAVNISSGVRVVPPRPLEPNWLSFQCHLPLLRRRENGNCIRCIAMQRTRKCRVVSKRRSNIRFKWNFRLRRRKREVFSCLPPRPITRDRRINNEGAKQRRVTHYKNTSFQFSRHPTSLRQGSINRYIFFFTYRMVLWWYKTAPKTLAPEISKELLWRVVK